MVKGKAVMNGAFGVAKPGKFLEDERPILPLIIDFRGTNSVSRILTGDVKTLSGAAAFQHVVLFEGKVVRSRMMVFKGKVKWSTLGFNRPGEVHVGAAVLPMGWASAVGVLQHAHRRLALRNPLRGGAGLLPACEVRRDAMIRDLGMEERAWSLYLDDTNLLEVTDKKVAEALSGNHQMNKIDCGWHTSTGGFRSAKRNPWSELQREKSLGLSWRQEGRWRPSL